MIESTPPFDPEDQRAWRALQTGLRPFVAKRVGRETDVDDVMQDILVRIQRGLPSLRDEDRFGAWVYRVARTAIVDHVRRSARRPLVLAGDEASLVPADAPSRPEVDEGMSVSEEVAGYAALFVAMLPSPYREALTLTDLEGLTQAQAARMLGISVSGMKSRVQRGRRKLREALEACCHIGLDARQRVIACEPRVDGTLPKGCCDPED